jgi:hypothetical protein
MKLDRHCHQDTFKVSGKQVSPSEIENTLRGHPSQLIIDVAVAGVKGERLSSELVPRAWVVLSNIGKEKGLEAALAALDEWARSRLSKHKWLRGGLQAVDEVSDLYFGKSMNLSIDVYVRYQNFLLARSCAVNCRLSMLESMDALAPRQSCSQSCDVVEPIQYTFLIYVKGYTRKIYVR